MDSEILAASMPQTPPDTHVGRCKSCGQPALLPEALELMVVCPRCGTEAKAAELLLLTTPEAASSRRSHDPEFVNAATILAMRSPSGDLSEPGRDSSRQLGNGLLTALDRVNRFVGGRRCLLFATFVTTFGVTLPVLDHFLSNGRLTLTIVFADLLLLCLWLLLFSWATSLRDESGHWRGSRLGSGFGVLFSNVWEAVTEWRHSTRASRLRRCGVVLVWTGVLQVALHGVLTLIATISEPSISQSYALSLVPWGLGAFAIGLGLGILLWATFEARKSRSWVASSKQDTPNIDDLPAIIDMSEAPQRDFGTTDVCHAVLSALTKWNERARKRYGTRDAYLAAFVRHLRQVAPSLSIRREVWLGRTREMGIADVVISNQLLIHIQKGFDRAAADWSLSQLHAYQLTRPKNTKLLVLFDTDRNQLLNSAVQSALGQMRQRAKTLVVRV